jgi:DNA-directed RNA polymerase sigma subunit (sigma70/sigma32)
MGENKFKDYIKLETPGDVEIAKLLCRLTAKERYVIVHRLGLFGEFKSKKQLSEELNTEYSVVQSIEKNALKKLKREG